MERAEVICGDSLQVMPTLPADSVDLLIADPPYFKVKDRTTCGWDHQWKTAADYLEWVGKLCREWQRLLKPNGSLYVFASPQMAARVEVEIGKTFNVLNRITWRKEDLHRLKTPARCGWDLQRSFVPFSEAILFAEHYNADNIAKGEAGYAAKCDELRGFVFEPLRAYLDGERERAGVSVRQVAEAFQRKTGSRTVTGMAGHWFGRVQWTLPTAENYQWLRATLSSLNHQGEYLRREYEDLRREYEDLRREYEDLRREYEDLRRPFSVSADVPYTDVWDFPTVTAYKGKHPCEKPLPLLSHIVRASSRPGALVFDPFVGSGSTGQAALAEGRRFLGIELDPTYCAAARQRIAFRQPSLEGCA